MSTTSFIKILGLLLEIALADGLPIGEIGDALSVANMVLDERRPERTYTDESTW